MIEQPLRVLILEDNPADAELAVAALKAEGFAPTATVVETEADFHAALGASFDVVITDYTLPAFDGLRAIRLVRAKPGKQPALIVVTGTANDVEAVECIRAGADDYLLKDRPARLGQAVRQAVARREARDQVEHAENELRDSEEHLNEAQRIGSMGSWQYTLADCKLTVSQGFRELFDLVDAPTVVDLDVVIGRIHPGDRARVRAGVEQRPVGAPVSETEYRILRRDGTERTIRAAGEVVRKAESPIATRGTAQDITHSREDAQQLLRSVQLFEQGFQHSPVGMGLVDPAQRTFTRVNDALCAIYGEPRSTLQSTGWLRHATLPEDIAADEAIYAKMVEGALDSDERQKRFVRPDGSVRWISRSLSAMRDPTGAIECVFCQVIDITDQKEQEAELRAQLDDVAWLARIRDALDHDRFVLYGQPIVHFGTGKTVRHELLIRMLSQDGAVIAPAEFLPVAERHGLIAEIDRWVVRRAVDVAAQGQAVQFNISGASIGDPSVLHELASAIERTGVEPSLLVVEVTETAMMTKFGDGRLFAEQVAAIGCRLALDDFGTGYATLSYLQQIPAHILKIDMEFVRDVTRGGAEERIVRGIIGLAREFDLTMIAEGIEDEATLECLRGLGVELGQGYFLGRPQPLTQGSLLAAGEPRARTYGADPADPVQATLPIRSQIDALPGSYDVDLPGARAHDALVERDRVLLAEMISRYRRQVGPTVARIKRAMESRDPSSVSRDILSLKRRGAAIAAARVAAIADHLKATGRAGDAAPAGGPGSSRGAAVMRVDAALRLASASRGRAWSERRASMTPNATAGGSARLVHAYGDALRLGDPYAAAAVIDDALGHGLSSAEIQSRVIAPAMWRIGELWERARLTVAQEHLATAVSQHVLTRLYPGSLSQVRRRGDTIVVAAVHGEHHALGLRMAADVLEGAGFDVRFLGADLPQSSLMAWVSEHRPAAVALGVTMPLGAVALMRQLHALHAYDPEMHLIVGGQGVPRVLHAGAGVFYAADTEQLLEHANRAVRTKPSGPLPPGTADGGISFGRSLGADTAMTEGVEARLARTTTAVADGARGQARRAFELERIAFRDPLTELWNRRAFDDRYQDLTCAELTPAPTVLMIDVDHFKSVNDRFGHAYGDQALIDVALCITRAMRPNDFAARYGGDEFAVLLPDTSARAAARIGERIRSAVNSKVTGPPVTVSIGVSVPDHADRRRAKLDVDRALYEAKRHGRNQVTFA